jgi:hypothetical protein
VRLLQTIGGAASELAAAVGAAAVLEVPVEIAGRGPSWVADATGTVEGELELPGYPLGDAEPERWREPPVPPRRATFELHRDLARLRELRGVLTRLIRSWRLEGRVDADALHLLASEVAANALVHAGTDATAVICYLGDLVRVTVVDGSSAPPMLRDAALDEVSGRGLALVNAHAKGWGVHPLPTGKEIWFDLAVSTS